MAGDCALPAPRLASDCPAHSLYPCSLEAITEHTTAYRAAAIAHQAKAGPYIRSKGIPRYRGDSLRTYNGSMVTARDSGAVSSKPGRYR